jgi:hypothetical protein
MIFKSHHLVFISSLNVVFIKNLNKKKRPKLSIELVNPAVKKFSQRTLIGVKDNRIFYANLIQDTPAFFCHYRGKLCQWFRKWQPRMITMKSLT